MGRYILVGIRLNPHTMPEYKSIESFQRIEHAAAGARTLDWRWNYWHVFDTETGQVIKEGKNGPRTV